jgi:hypothetical protein
MMMMMMMIRQILQTMESKFLEGIITTTTSLVAVVWMDDKSDPGMYLTMEKMHY